MNKFNYTKKITFKEATMDWIKYFTTLSLFLWAWITMIVDLYILNIVIPPTQVDFYFTYLMFAITLFGVIGIATWYTQEKQKWSCEE